MKKILLLAVLTLLGIGMYAQQGAPGQGRGPKLSPEERATQTIERLKATVELTTEEQAKVTEIFKNFYTDQQPLFAERNFEKMQALMTSRDEKVKAVLTDETKYNAYIKFMQEQRSRGGRGGGGRNNK